MDIYCRKIIKQVTHVMIYWQDRFLMHYIILPLKYRLRLLLEYERLELHCWKNKITNGYKWGWPPILGPKVNDYVMKWVYDLDEK